MGGVVIIGGGDLELIWDQNVDSSCLMKLIDNKSHRGLLGVEVPLPNTEHPGLESRATVSATL